jgi:hypothetical protein
MISEVHEKRGKLRISIPLHARVKGLDLAGRPFVADTVLDNISAGGLYLRSLSGIGVGESLFIEIALQCDHRLADDEPRFACEGTVMRSEPGSGGAYGIAVKFSKIQFE